MKQELQDQLVDILSSISNTVGQAKDFALVQLPDIAQSYILYGRVLGTFILTMSVISIIVFIYIAYRLERRASGGYKGLPSTVAVVASVIPFVFFICNFSSTLLVWFAPKVWLLKEIARLIR